MAIEPIGILVVLVGILCLLGRQGKLIVYLFCGSTLLGSSAAIFIGYNNISPDHLLILFVFLSVYSVSEFRYASYAALKYPRSGFWLLSFGVFAILSAYFFPILFAGSTGIVPLGASQYASTTGTVPLGRVSSNLTQSIYLIGDIACFAAISGICSSPRGAAVVTNGVYIFIVGNLVFAMLDVGTYFSGTKHLLDWLRNTRYQMHENETVAGLKRIVGLYPEASAFAGESLGAYGFAAMMWLLSRKRTHLGLLAVATGVAIVLSTSSSGILGFLGVSMVLFWVAIWLAFRQSHLKAAVTVLVAPLVLGLTVVGLMLDKQISYVVQNYINITLLAKYQTDSAIERLMWNKAALQNFIDTLGVGVGFGTIRTSNLLLALLGNVGIVGTIMYCVFLGSVGLQKWGDLGSDQRDVRISAAFACFALILGSMFSAPAIDPGLFFMVLANTNW